MNPTVVYFFLVLFLILVAEISLKLGRIRDNTGRIADAQESIEISSGRIVVAKERIANALEKFVSPGGVNRFLNSIAVALEESNTRAEKGSRRQTATFIATLSGTYGEGIDELDQKVENLAKNLDGGHIHSVQDMIEEPHDCSFKHIIRTVLYSER